MGELRTKIVMNNIFYVYIYLDPRKLGSFDYGEFHFDFEPFYVGKGCKEQWSSHLKLAEIKIYKSYKLNKIRKIQSLGLQPKIIKYKDNLTEQEAFDLEKKLIKAIGRLDLGLGPLVNLTDGGEGVKGVIAWSTGKTKGTHPGIARMSEKLKVIKKGKLRGTKEDTPWIARAAEKRKGRTKETYPGVERAAEKHRGRTKENHTGVARMAEKKKGRNKENDSSVASMSEKLRGRTKETDPGYTKISKVLTGRTKETHIGVARQAEKMKEQMKGNECSVKTHDIIFVDGTKQTIKNLAKFCRETGFKLGKDFKEIRNG